ncbi:hypothetical protein NGM37_17990, partial [Streptomyces sp. TRM76130]|nr:hypothetical protein [Streptomyces sp. TRM76130]
GPQSPAAPQPQNPQNRPAPAGAPQGLQAAAPDAPQPAREQDAFGNAAPQRGRRKGRNSGDSERGRRPQLPARGGPRAELPGGAPQPTVPSWSDGNAQPSVDRAAPDAPRGHEEPDVARTAPVPRIDDRQGPAATAEMPVIGRSDAQGGPAATAEFARPDFDAPAPGTAEARQTGRFAAPDRNAPSPADPFGGPGGQDGAPDPFVRSDIFGAPATANGAGDQSRFSAPQTYQDGTATGRHGLPGPQDPAAPGQLDRQDANGADRYSRQDPSTTGQYDRQDQASAG